ncbi:MAG: peptide ABC transporter substrate-binding protein [Parcubacteria group bacterium]|nr:peptide ABC transporter substrate-binding protein [Parcubacteria group bacterium]
MLSSFRKIFTLERFRLALRNLSRKEKILLAVFAGILAIGLFAEGLQFYLTHTTKKPAFGGVYTEGVVGAPRYINPVLGDSSEGDRTLEALIFSGLLKADYRGGVMPDLAASYEILRDEKTYLVTLKDDVFWHDGKPLTADDVIYTIELIKNPEIRNPSSANWQDVRVEKITDKTLRFVLPSPYQFFLSNLTFGILPKHLWGSVPAQNFPLVERNLKPIGSGPYRFKNLQKDREDKITQYTLVRNPKYAGPGPYFDTLIIRFFESYDEAIRAEKKKEIDGLAGIPLEMADSVLNSPSLKVLQPTIPRYFAVFFNMESDLFQEARAREALARGVEKENLVKTALAGQGEIISSPIVPGLLGAKEIGPSYNPEAAKALLSQAGWRMSEESGILKKKAGKNELAFEFELLFPLTQNLPQVAEAIAKNWASLGINAKLKGVSIGEFTTALQNRTYDAVLFGEVFATGRDPDPFPFWHSSQKNPPGLNLSLYNSSRADTLLERIRRERDEKKRADLLREFQTLLEKDVPAVFLYRPNYLYTLTSNINLPEMEFLNTPQERLSRVNEWFINTKRSWR